MCPWIACFFWVLIWIYLNAPMFVFNVSVSGWASCYHVHVFWERQRRRRRRRKRRLRPKQVSMSHRILRLLTRLIHYCWPSPIIDEQVQCHMALEPTLPILTPSTTNTTATATATLPESFTTLELLYHLSGMWPTQTGSRDNIWGRRRKDRTVILQQEGDNTYNDDHLRLPKQDLTCILSHLVFLSVYRFHFTSKQHSLYLKQTVYP